MFFQDDRLWIQYGGQYSAAGQHGSCPDRYHGKAYINSAEWDITALGACQAGGHCPVSPTFTDEQFEVPQGCASVAVTTTTMRGRGVVTNEAPSAGNGWRGSLRISDPAGGANVYDVRVSLTCAGGATGTPLTPVRLSCTHTFGTDSCHMGRIEVFNPGARHLGFSGIGTWGTVWCDCLVVFGRSLVALWSLNFTPCRSPSLTFVGAAGIGSGKATRWPQLSASSWAIWVDLRASPGNIMNIWHPNTVD